MCTSVCEQPFLLRGKCELLLVPDVVSVAVSCNLEAPDCEEPVDLVLSHPRERKAEWVELSRKGLSVTPRSASYWSLLLTGYGLQTLLGEKTENHQNIPKGPYPLWRREDTRSLGLEENETLSHGDPKDIICQQGDEA